MMLLCSENIEPSAFGITARVCEGSRHFASLRQRETTGARLEEVTTTLLRLETS